MSSLPPPDFPTAEAFGLCASSQAHSRPSAPPRRTPLLRPPRRPRRLRLRRKKGQTNGTPCGSLQCSTRSSGFQKPAMGNARLHFAYTAQSHGNPPDTATHDCHYRPPPATTGNHYHSHPPTTASYAYQCSSQGLLKNHFISFYADFKEKYDEVDELLLGKVGFSPVDINSQNYMGKEMVASCHLT